MKKMKTLCLPVLLSSVDAIAIRPSLLPAALRAPSLALWRRPQPDAPPSSLAVPLMEDDEKEAEQQQQQQQQQQQHLAEDRFAFSVESPHSAAAVAPYRRFAVGATALAALGAPLLNAQLARVWSAVRVTPWFRNDMFEPLVAVGSFFVWIHLWFGVDWLASSGRAPGLRKYQIVPKKAAGIDDGDDNNAAGRQRLSKWYAGWFWEMAVYLVPLWGIATYTDWFAPRRAALAMAAPSVARVAREIVGGLFLYDFFFWFGHVALHKLAPRRLYGRLHGKHHVSRDVRASDTVRLTVFEETVDVMCSIAALRILRAHPLSRCLYNVVITGLLVELHCGYDMPWSPQNVVPGNVVAGSRRHHMHHAASRVYFQKFFTWLDELCGFVLKKQQQRGQLHQPAAAVRT